MTLKGSPETDDDAAQGSVATLGRPAVGGVWLGRETGHNAGETGHNGYISARK